MKKVLIICTALAFLSPAVLMAEEKHDHATSATTEVKLNKGKKWETDAPLRNGMTGIKDAMASQLGEIHSGKLTKSQYAELAAKITGHTDSIFKNCKLSPEADAQLHIILVQILEGTKDMKDSDLASSREYGAVKVVKALELYPKYFKHSGWKPLKH